MVEKTELTAEEKAEMEKVYVKGHEFHACIDAKKVGTPDNAHGHDFDCCAADGDGSCEKGYDFSKGPEGCALK